MNVRAQDSSDRQRLPLVPAVLVSVIVVALVFTLRQWTTVQGVVLIVTALSIAALDPFPIYLDPYGELRLTTVIVIPTLVFFGWPTALLGAAAGMATAFFYRPPGEVAINGAERLAAIIVAAAAASVSPRFGPNAGVSSAIVLGLAYAVFRTLVVSDRMHRDEGIAWRRALRFVSTATFFHMGVFTMVAAIVVWMVSSDPSTTSRLFVPMLAATVTLQLYLPRILRGREQRRVLAAVSVLAAAVDAKDPYTADHSNEVAGLSRRIGRILNLEEPEVHQIYLAALLHDVGKTVVPSQILLKPGKLTDEEWKIMQSHVEAGVRIVESISELSSVAPIVAASHERVDGRGYPLGLKESQIPIGSRINLVVDAYNALTTNRPYRAARSANEALSELEANAGTQFDPQVVRALRTALEQPQAHPSAPSPGWIRLFLRPAFALLWAGELVSFIGDNIFFVAITLWVLKLTGSVTALAASLIAATVGQGLLALFAGALTDRIDRRAVIISSDVGRALIVCAIPFVLPHSIPAGLVLLMALNVGTVFFRTGVFALIPTVVSHEELLTANALFQTTQRIGEIVGASLGGVIVLELGYDMALYLDALTFVFSAICVALIPVVWRAGLESSARKQITVEIADGLRFMWRTPIHRTLALLILPGYLTLAFDALQTPMVVKTAGLSAVAYGVINSFLGVGKLLSAIVLSGVGRPWINVTFVVAMFSVSAIATELFGATTNYGVLIAAAFLFGVGNVAANIANATLSMANASTGIIGRLIASRQLFVALTTAVGMLVFGWMADVVGAPTALITLGFVSGVGVLIVWLLLGRQTAQAAKIHVTSSGNG
jgi:putative nucleotidyltransferase with HDIG domain